MARGRRRGDAPPSGPKVGQRGHTNEQGLRALGQEIAGNRGAGPVPNAAGLQALAAQIDQAKKGGKHARSAKSAKKKHSAFKWAFITFGVMAVLVVGSGAGYAWYLNSEVHRIHVKGLAPAVTQGKDAGTQNILMVGSTTRCGLKTQTPAYGLCTEGVTGVNSDVVMVLHLNPSVPSVSILSIPRDLFIPNARSTGAWKIDAALAQGPTQLVAAIEEDFGIPIQHYVELNFDTFAGVVDALGGITMYFPEPVFDAESGLNARSTGCRHLPGVQALQVVRARHLQYKSPTTTSTTPTYWPQEGQSDLARIRRDHEFLRVLATAVVKKGITNPVTDGQLVASVVPDLTVDSSFSASDMVTLMLSYHGVSVSSSPQYTLPVSVDGFGSYQYQGYTFGDVEFPPEPQQQSVIDQFLGVTNDVNTMTGGHLPPPTTVTVKVLNGSGTSDTGTTTATDLAKLGFKITGTGTTAPVGVEAETTVAYAIRTANDVADAQLVARSLSGAVIMDYTPKMTGANVTVTTGSDFTVDTVAPAPTPVTTTTVAPAKPKKKSAAATTTTVVGTGGAVPGTSTAGTATTTTTQAASSTSKFAAPSTPSEPLQPWDPRSCTPTGGEGT